MRKTITPGAPAAPIVASVQAPIEKSAPRFFNRAGIEDVYKRIVDTETSGLENRMQRLILEENDMHGRIDRYVHELSLVRKAKREMLVQLETARARTIDTSSLDIIKRMPWVQSVRSKENSIIVRTRLLFTPVRIEDGSREEVRRCIGSFDIVLKGDRSAYNYIRVYMHNVLFGSMYYDHWAIRAGQPCFGTYTDEINAATGRRDIYAILDTLYHFLMSTDDGSAWRRSHHWVSMRKEINTSAASYRNGDRVIARNPDGDSYIDIDGYGVVQVGTAGTVLRAEDNRAYVRWDSFEFDEEYAEDEDNARENIDDSHLDGNGEYTQWWVHNSYLTKDGTDGARVYTDESLHRLDTLPDFASLEEGMNALRARPRVPADGAAQPVENVQLSSRILSIDPNTVVIGDIETT